MMGKKRAKVIKAALISSLVASSISSSVVLADGHGNTAQVTHLEVMTMEAKAKTKELGMALKKVLKQELSANGLESAVQVCNVKAPLIADQTSKDGWSVSRTALKVRNSDNAPDAWETEVLERFEQKLSAGADPKTLDEATIKDGKFRYMKAIPTGQVCLACHGSSVQPELNDHIQTLYPKDQATGFELGQLRGAFSLTKSVK